MLILRLRNYAIKDRVAEWFMGAVLTAMGVGMIFQPRLFSLNPFFTEFLRVAPAEVWSAGLTILGTVRVIALCINGAWRKSPHLRLATAMASMFVWYQFSALSTETKFPNLGMAVYPAILLLELYCVYFAACDAGLSDEAAKAVRE